MINLTTNGEDNLTVTIDLTRDSLFDQLGLTRLKESYMLDTESSPQERYKYVAELFGSNPTHAQRIYDYLSLHWLGASSPILSMGRTKHSLPISCFKVFIDDTAHGLVDSLSETNWLSMAGGGVGLHVQTRSADDKSTGVMPHMKVYDAAVEAYRQGTTRRGSYAPFLDIDHPDVLQFLQMRKPTGDPNIRCHNLHHGLNITDKFMQLIEKCMVDKDANDAWALIDPHTKEEKGSVSAKWLWEQILRTRMETGEPYLHFIDTANRALPDHLKEHGLKIHGSNICVEIELPTSADRTAVCCLSSVNLDYYDQWKDNQMFYDDVLEFLDNVLQYFIDKAPNEYKRARYSAMRERSVGVGVLGFHSYLQSKGIPFESALAKSYNLSIFKRIKNSLDKANERLSTLRGPCIDAQLAGKNIRLSHTMAVAPTATNSIILGNTSPSIEPYRANAYRQDTLSGSFLNKNRHLDKILKARIESEKEYNAVWSSIISNHGSVQHVKQLTDDEKSIFKTFEEIDQRWVVEFAGDRAPLIDQGQSVNTMFAPDTNVKYLHAVHFSAWKKGVKALYYCRSRTVRAADKIGEKIERKIIESINMQSVINGEECLACQ